MKLPERLRSLSILDAEITLPYPEVLEAIEILRLENIGLLGWELILKGKDGRISHPTTVVGYSTSFEDDESYDNFVERSTWNSKTTIENFYKNEAENYSNIELYFCITENET